MSVTVFDNLKKSEEDFWFKKNKTARVCFASSIGEQACIQRNENGTDKFLPLELHSESQYQASIALIYICELCDLNLMHYCIHEQEMY